MNENLRNILTEIETAIREISEMYERGPIYSSQASSDELGREAVYRKNLTPGIVLRLVNDGSYTISGTATEEEKREFIAALEELTNINSGEVSQELKDAIYPIIDAVEMSIEEPERDAQIQDIEIDNSSEREDEEETEQSEEEEQELDDDAEQEENENTELENHINELKKDIEFLGKIDSTITKIDSRYEKNSKSITEKDEKTDITAFMISTKFILSDLGELAIKIQRTIEESKSKNEVIEIDYDSELKDILDGIKKEYDNLNENKIKNMSPELKKEFDDLMKIIESRLKQLKVEQNKDDNSSRDESDEETDNSENNDNKEKDKEDDFLKPKAGTKGLTIIFNAKTGKYVLYDGETAISDADPDQIFRTDEEDRILEELRNRNPDYDEEDLYKYIDPVVYIMLIDYDKVHNTNYAQDFVKAVFEPKKYDMPIELRYLLSRKNELEKNTYKDIKFFAKQYEKDKIATVKKDKKEIDLPGVRGEGSLLSKLKELGTGIIAAIMNFGYNLKDVVKGKKKFKELFSLNAFKRLDSGETKEFNKKDDKKKEDKKEKQDNKKKEDKTETKEYKGAKVGIKFKDGMYTMRTGDDLDSEIRYGDTYVMSIAVRDKKVIQNKLGLSDEEMKSIDPTVYAALRILEEDKRYTGISERYIEAARKGDILPELRVDYDLSTLGAIDEAYMTEADKNQVRYLAKQTLDKSRGKVVPEAKTVKPEAARMVNSMIEKAYKVPEYIEKGFVIPGPDVVYKKTDLDMARRMKAVLKDKLKGKSLSDDERRAEYSRILLEMAQKRGVEITDENKKFPSELMYSIIRYDADKLEKDSSYLMPEEKERAMSKSNQQKTSQKGKKNQRDAKKGTEK